MTRSYKIKIPSDVSVLYCKKNKVLIVSGPLRKTSLKLELKISVEPSKKVILVNPESFFRISNSARKKIKSIQNTTISKIKHRIIESSNTVFQKLKIVGVGYRANVTQISDKNLLTLKLGYSHSIYVKAPNQISLNSLTKTNINLLGTSYSEVTTFSASIRKKKVPDPYKGKGILYENEKPQLKEGKKV